MGEIRKRKGEAEGAINNMAETFVIEICSAFILSCIWGFEATLGRIYHEEVLQASFKKIVDRKKAEGKS